MSDSEIQRGKHLQICFTADNATVSCNVNVAKNSDISLKTHSIPNV